MGNAGGHYFDADPAVRSRPSAVRLALPDRSLTLGPDRGVFSAEQVDSGTKSLLLEAPEPPPGRTFVHLGRGYGPHARPLHARRPAARECAVDAKERARAWWQP